MTIAEASKVFCLTPDTLRYYKRIGMIPPVSRTPGGIRDYREKDCKWVELSKCMRDAGLPVEAIIEYVRLYQQGDVTIAARLALLQEQHALLLERRLQIDGTLDRLKKKIVKYEAAVKTGTLSPN